MLHFLLQKGTAKITITQLRVDPRSYDVDEGVELLLKTGSRSIIQCECHCFTALHWAAAYGHENLTRVLLERGANIKAEDRYGSTALHWAAKRGHGSSTILVNGLYVEVPTEEANPAAHPAAGSDHETVVRLLLDNGAHVDTLEDTHHTPLYEAVLRGDHAMAKILLERGADPTISILEGGFTPLKRAVCDDDIKLVRMMATPANVDERNGGCAPLVTAAAYNCQDIIKELLDLGASIELKCGDGRPALYYATRYGHTEAMTLLLERGANVNARGNNLDTMLHLAMQWGRSDVIKILLDNGADVDARNENGATSIHQAHSCSDGEMGMLLNKGADVNALDNARRTALHYAAEYGRTSMAELLLARGANPALLDIEQRTAADVARTYGSNGVLELLCCQESP